MQILRELFWSHWYERLVKNVFKKYFKGTTLLNIYVHDNSFIVYYLSGSKIGINKITDGYVFLKQPNYAHKLRE